MPLCDFMCDGCGESIKDVVVYRGSLPSTGETKEDILTGDEGQYGVLICDRCGSRLFTRTPTSHSRQASWSNW
jgi:hypothetical protein